MVRIDAARSEEERADGPERWSDLGGGTWLVTEQFERRGRAYYLLQRVGPETARVRALTERELEVVRSADLGHSNKQIAFSLGLSPSTVSTLLDKARAKLGARRR